MRAIFTDTLRENIRYGRPDASDAELAHAAEIALVDEFARDLLTSSGSNFRVPPVNFYRGVQDRNPAGLAQAAATAKTATAGMPANAMTSLRMRTAPRSAGWRPRARLSRALGELAIATAPSARASVDFP